MKNSNPYKLRSKKTDIYKNTARAIKKRREKFSRTKDLSTEDKAVNANPSEKFYALRSLRLKNKITLMKKTHYDYAMKIHEPRRRNKITWLFIAALGLFVFGVIIGKKAKTKQILITKPPDIALVFIKSGNFPDIDYLKSGIRQNKHLKLTNNPEKAHIILDLTGLKKENTNQDFAKMILKLHGKNETWKIFPPDNKNRKHALSEKILQKLKLP